MSPGEGGKVHQIPFFWTWTLLKPCQNSKISADCKRGRRKGATSKNVKNRQKVSKNFSTLLDNFRAGKKRQKTSKRFSTLFDNFRVAPFFRPLLGGSENNFFPVDILVPYSRMPTGQKVYPQHQARTTHTHTPTPARRFIVRTSTIFGTDVKGSHKNFVQLQFSLIF